MYLRKNIILCFVFFAFKTNTKFNMIYGSILFCFVSFCVIVFLESEACDGLPTVCLMAYVSLCLLRVAAKCFKVYVYASPSPSNSAPISAPSGLKLGRKAAGIKQVHSLCVDSRPVYYFVHEIVCYVVFSIV